MLSQAARTTLIKAVVSAIPIYHMQHTWLSKSEEAKCDGVMRKFFWSQWDESKTPVMISWKRLCKGQSEGGGFWDEAKVAKVYTSYKQALILDTVISHTNVEDKIVWNITDNGEFSVKKAYKIITNNTHTHGSPSFKWNRFWQLPLPQRVSKSLQTAHGCDAAETEEHIFKDCQFAKRVWFASRLNLRSDDINALSMSDWISQKISNLSKTSSPQHKEIVMLLLSICWSLYTQRNHLLFQQGKADVAECLNRAYKIVDEIVGIDIIQRQDHFFNLEVPMKQRGDGFFVRQIKRVEAASVGMLDCYCARRKKLRCVLLCASTVGALPFAAVCVDGGSITVCCCVRRRRELRCSVCVARIRGRVIIPNSRMTQKMCTSFRPSSSASIGQPQQPVEELQHEVPTDPPQGQGTIDSTSVDSSAIIPRGRDPTNGKLWIQPCGQS
ncbi:ribonuclease H [Senna tora]|uniref:Ribonuclease H n=1 Tax=Senna tora TaxID=362788 RepID=A0A834SVX2_9FABA|nr:ribonuclease H [Senna tora]